MAWTKERLEEVAQARLAGARLVVVANREPYIHVHAGDGIDCLRPASGLTTALDPVVKACGGVWVAHGSGDADRAVCDERGRVAVPPEDPAYVLRRVWLTEEEERGYYYGFANEALWPLCHVVYSRPSFRPDDWQHYRQVNRKFADAVLEEIADGPAVVFVQDYHFALLPRMIKRARPDAVVLHFWHIPWPAREVFRICPWQEELLDGLLGNDLLAFHVQQHCNNFLDTVDRGLEARLDMDRFCVTRKGHTTTVRPQAISIDPDLEAVDPETAAAQERALRERLGLGDRQLLVGVDRADYTKGIIERFDAVDHLLQQRPELAGQFHMVQVAAPTRGRIPAYRTLSQEIDAHAAAINARHAIGDWKPIICLQEHFGPAEVFALYRAAAGCVVTSLHDGMNLVAKEFVAARTDLRGALVLSRFTGAARELTDALLVNPYDLDGTARMLHHALTMPAAEQERRMARMRQQVTDHNIYRWAGMLLSEVGRLLPCHHAAPAVNGRANGWHAERSLS